jgi:hypothetical protein
MRYFRSSPAVYQAVCSQLNAAYGYPNAATKTDRALPLAGELPSDVQGRVYLLVPDEQCYYVLPAQMLTELLASGAVEEITPEQYRAAVKPLQG